MTIYLGGLLPARSSSLPETRGKRAASRFTTGACTGCDLYPCLALLQMGVTWPRHYCQRRWSLTPPFHPYPFQGGLFLWPDPVDCSTPGVTRHLALRSADFPRPGRAGPRSPDLPEGLYHTINPPDLLVGDVASPHRRPTNQVD